MIYVAIYFSWLNWSNEPIRPNRNQQSNALESLTFVIYALIWWQFFFFQKYVTKSPTYNFHRSDFRNSENLKECISLIETIPVT